MNPRVLYVDDEEDLRLLVQCHLAADGYDVDVAPDGPTALEMIGRTPYDLILLDLHMPGMSGAAVIADLRRRNLHPVFAILTGDSSQDAELQCRLLGAVGVLRKPFTFGDLALAVQRALKGAEAGDAAPFKL